MTTNTFHARLFHQGFHVYSVIDGASTPPLLGKLAEYEPKHTCLFRGELSLDMAEVAPYLVKLEADDNFTHWLIEVAMESPCCIFAQTDNDFLSLRKHFRSFLRVESPEGETLHFRYYDPRVLRVYLPSCGAEENKVLYSDIIEQFFSFDIKEQRLNEFKPITQQA
ncbi:MAG: DUF4123 domain-containing protein [Cocleimonas sp.]|nr:DUF4123 domain-containing protein [Cocleimonas sp.]